MKILLYLIFAVAKLQIARCQGFGGGASSFGYDASSACSKPYSRAARARFENLPCDFKRQNWCTVAGSAYPWHAVRRFVQENQGLMRRMYGEERHISVLRAELTNNDVDEPEIEEEESFLHSSDNSRNFQYQDDYGFEDDDQDNMEEREEEYEGRGFTSRALDDVSPRRRFSKFPKLGDFTRPHFRPAGTTLIPTTTTTTTTEGSRTNLTLVESTGDSKKESSEKENPQEPTTLVTTLTEIANIQNLSINEIPGQLNDRLDTNVDNFTDLPANPETTTDETTLETSGTSELPTTVIVDRIDAMIEDEPARNNPKEEIVDQVFAASEQQFRPRPEFRPPEIKPEASSMEGQLFQDVAAKDPQPPLLKLRGVNACPVKEEVVAPFWANNTRGEVLALLNLYPFEQYVHWEKCTHENKQMYCRDGCRCEQQYRLHRLLAYDPNNECRGIFSDWFKFPSCCVCRCYDLPIEFRVTSRSPRTQRPRRKMHNRISSEWYRHGG